MLWETMGIRLRCGLLLDRRRGVRRSTLCGKVVRVSYDVGSPTFHPPLRNPLSRVNRVLHRAITPIIPIISTRNSMQGRIITRLLKVAHAALRIPFDYRLTGLIDHRSTRVESTRAKSCSKLTFQEIPPRSAYDPPRSCAGSLQRSSFISRPVMLPLFNSI